MTPTKPPGNGRSAARRWTRGARPGRIANSLVVLSSAAIVSVYAVGYARTQSAADQISAADASVAQVAQATSSGQTVAPTVATPANTAPSTATATPRTNAAGGTPQTPTTAATTARPTSTSTPSPVATQTSGYRDGTYTGSGTSRHGGVTVSVVIQGGKITSAAITICQTRYPCSQISSLQGQVISRQSASIDHVSGATDSSTAYRQAVTAALARAK